MQLLAAATLFALAVWIPLSASTVLGYHELSTEYPTNKKTVSEKLFFKLEELSRLVGISYCVGYQGITQPFECLSHCSDFEHFELVKTWDSGVLDSASCGYIALSHPPNPPRIILAFRGSNSLSDAISDLMTMPAEYAPYEPPHNDTSASATSTSTVAASGPERSGNNTKCANCQVHAGFLAAWHSTRDILLDDLRNAVWKYPDYKVVLTGHSLGGAIAGLAALEFDAMGWEPTVTTFGEPRFGNAELAKYTDRVFSFGDNEEIGRYRRVTHVNDPIPLYPPEILGWKMHAGEVYISKSALPPSREDLMLCHGAEDPACINGQERPETALREQAGEGWLPGFPAEWKLWEILFAHREYFWRLGLCWDPQSRDYPNANEDSKWYELR